MVDEKAEVSSPNWTNVTETKPVQKRQTRVFAVHKGWENAVVEWVKHSLDYFNVFAFIGNYLYRHFIIDYPMLIVAHKLGVIPVCGFWLFNYEFIVSRDAIVTDLGCASRFRMFFVRRLHFFCS